MSPPPSQPARRHRRGFSIVELLVVIGIIALLIAILLPALSKAREQSRTVKCLSNLRQLGLAEANYTSETRGYLLPADVFDPALASEPNGRVWSDTWVTILVGLKYLNYQATNANRLNARHNRATVTNLLFFDGHADSYPTAALPGGLGDANPAGTTFGKANLQDPKYAGGPKWRLDQDDPP